MSIKDKYNKWLEGNQYYWCLYDKPIEYRDKAILHKKLDLIMEALDELMGEKEKK